MVHADCVTIQLLIQSEKCLYFLEIRGLNRNDHIASYMYFFTPNATTCESTAVEIN